MREYRGRTGQLVTLAVFLAVMLGLFPSTPAQAQGLAFPGNFYRQHFQLLGGETLENTGVYVTVINTGDSPVTVEVKPNTPLHVELLLSGLPEQKLTLQPEEQRQLDISVIVSPEAIPGDYTIIISAEAYHAGTGIKIAPGIEQEAKLTILGEAGRIIITSVTSEGESFQAHIGVYKEVEGNLSLVYPLQKSRLETKLTPGDYIAQARYQDIMVAEQEFSLAADEEKEIVLVCSTLCLSDFSISPYPGEDNLVSAKLSYTIANLLRRLSDVKAVLKVSLDGQPLEEVELGSFSTLDVGSFTGSYSYAPPLPQGWQEGHTYSFIIELYVKDKLYYQSDTQELVPGGGGLPGGGLPGVVPGGISWPIIGGIIAVVVVVAVVFLIRRRRSMSV